MGPVMSLTWIRCWVVLGVCVAVTLAVPDPALGAKKGKRDQDKKRYIDYLNKQIKELQGRRSRAESQLKSVQPQFDKIKDDLRPAKADMDSAIKEASGVRQEVTDARRAVIEAQKNLRVAQVKVRDELASSPDAAQAESDYKAAELALDQVRRPLIDKAQRDPEFRAVIQKAVDAQARLETLRAQAADGASIGQAAAEVLRFRKLADDLQKKMLAADAGYEKARLRYEAAAKVYQAQKEAIAELVDSNAEVQSAISDVEAAKSDLGKANEAFAEANKRVAAARSEYTRRATTAKKAAKVIDGLNGEIALVNRLIADRERKKKQAR